MDIGDGPSGGSEPRGTTPVPENDAPASSDRSMLNQTGPSHISRLGVQNPPEATPLRVTRAGTKTSKSAAKSAATPATKPVAKPVAKAASTRAPKTSKAATLEDITTTVAKQSSSGGLGPSGSAAVLGEVHALRLNVSDRLDTVDSHLLALGAEQHKMTKLMQSIADSSEGTERQLSYIADDAVHTAENTASLLTVARDSARDIHTGIETLQQLNVPREVHDALAPLIGAADKLVEACGNVSGATLWPADLSREGVDRMDEMGSSHDSYSLSAPMGPASGPSSVNMSSRARTWSGRDSPDMDRRPPPSFTPDRAARDSEPILLGRISMNQHPFSSGLGRGRGMRRGGQPYGGGRGTYRQ